ncbi:energy transducer TonB [Gracilimonas tropica]|uniref:energy transducer TonB n=1 Tax=Gracilimonas tropica TaxID=454600 RepID=UPI00036E12B8|nr:energy transducer TonB [Gracilimonas tropica]
MAEKKKEFGVVSPEQCFEDYQLPIYQNKNQVLKKIGYPPELRREGVQGSVSFSLIIDKQGNIDYAHLIHSSDSRLTELVRSGFRYLEIVPGSCNGKPATMMNDLNMHFRLSP